VTGDVAGAAVEIAARGFCSARPARDPVNAPMIRNWVEALGDANPLYLAEDVAPPAMAQVWTMRGLHPASDSDDPLTAMSAALDDAGYTSVVATDSDQAYSRYLRHGEQLSVRTRLVDVVGPKRTRLGEGFFMTTESIWTSGGEQVASMTFRILKFRPGTATTPPATPRIRPVISSDTAFFWAGTAAGELRVQRCGDCGRLRHPPGPSCPACGADKPEHVVACGRGEVCSYVVHRHPAIPGRKTPVVVALVLLAEGVRMVGELLDVDPDRVRIGMPVRIAYDRVDDDLVLPAWRPADLVDLPPLRLPVTPTFVIASALATRDFQDVHHDRDLAVRRGGTDIFMNILTTTGLVQRFVTDWAGPRARILGISIRLGVPCYPGDVLSFSGLFSPESSSVAVTGRTASGSHVTGVVQVELP
jgi:uncharacterized OB-fold protein